MGLKIWFEEVYDEVQPVEMPSNSGLFTYPKEKFSLPLIFCFISNIVAPSICCGVFVLNEMQ